MKKRFSFGVLVSLLLPLTAYGCTSGGEAAETETDSAAAVSEVSSSEEADVTTGASEVVYTGLEELEDSYDVIIIGSGGAGMAAAIEAKDQGLDPVIFEKMPVHGGNTVKSSAGMNASETKFQEEQGITDNNDTFYEETMTGGKETNDPDLVRYLVDHSAEAIDWLDSMDITLDNITITGGMSVERTHRPSDGSAVGEYLVAGLVANVLERDIPLFVNAEVTDILENEGKISGVNVTFEQDEEKTVEAPAVIVTTGGFGANMDMIEEYDPALADFVTTNQLGSTGDGIKMAQELGAAVVDMDQIQIHPTVQQDTSILISESVRGEGAILVSQNGERFYNEMETRDNVSAAILALPEKSAYLVLDAGVKERVKALDFYIEKGFVEEAATVEELAEKIGMPAENLAATLETWNQSVADQKDADFGRTTAMDNDLSTAPYYAIKIAPGIHHTMGGLKINTNTQVLKEDGTAIEGLYAAGEVTGGVHGSNRIGGNAVADIIIFGRQAGAQSAAYVSAQ